MSSKQGAKKGVWSSLSYQLVTLQRVLTRCSPIKLSVEPAALRRSSDDVMNSLSWCSNETHHECKLMLIDFSFFISVSINNIHAVPVSSGSIKNIHLYIFRNLNFVFSVLFFRSSVFCILALGSGLRTASPVSVRVRVRVSVSFSVTFLCLQLWRSIFLMCPVSSNSGASSCRPTTHFVWHVMQTFEINFFYLTPTGQWGLMQVANTKYPLL